MKVTLDVENTVTHRDGKIHLDPFEPDNSLTMVGMLTEYGVEHLVVFDHEQEEPTPSGKDFVQSVLDKTTLLIMHNASHDLLWLWECGFNYAGTIFDTMLNAYVQQRGLKQSLSLEDCAVRYNLDTKKQDTLKQYFKKGYSTKQIPIEELSEYLSADLHATQQLANILQDKLNNEHKELKNVAELTDKVAVCLTKIYQRGFTVDLKELENVKKSFEKERQTLISDLTQRCKDLMGDYPINLNSPEQLSWVLYSKKPLDKSTWANNFETYMNKKDFEIQVSQHSEVLYKQKALQCSECWGAGYINKIKKDGTPFKKSSKCSDCKGLGYIFKSDKTKIAGLKMKAPSAKWVSANGFSTNKNNLLFLEQLARQKKYTAAESFLKNVRRLSAVETYLSSFVQGINTYVKPDKKLHVRLLQHRTSTGRFSGADPNMQNMPRGNTFPVKKVFISRWTDGQILEADFAQLEFRVAAFLGQDKVAIEEVSTGFDVHSYTAKVITEAGQTISRQEAKAHTFAPLYGASGFGRTPAEATYYKQFNDKYEGIAEWHNKLAKQALNEYVITTPSGRQFSFPDVQRKSNGTPTQFTQIKNYPVQSFATADIVPISLLYIDNKLKDMQSCIVNTVHDSIVIDVHPTEVKQVIDIINETNNNLKTLIDKEWNIDFNVPLLLEAKIGYNWLDTKDVV